MKNICISVKALYDKYGEKLSYCNISTEDDGYYDLQTEFSGTVCMDGENCEVIEENDDVVKLLNKDGEINTTFTLTLEEFYIATLNISFEEIENWYRQGKSYEWIANKYNLTQLEILKHLERFALKNYKVADLI